LLLSFKKEDSSFLKKRSKRLLSYTDDCRLAKRVFRMQMPRRMRLALIALAFSSQATAEPAPVYKQANAPIPARVQDLLGRMTLEEKVAQLQSNSTLPPIPGLAVGPTPAFGIITKGQVDAATAKRVSITVTNSGWRAGDEIVQMYVHPRVSSVVQPAICLAGFKRIHLDAGEAQTVAFPVGPEQLAIWDRQMRHIVETGVVDVFVGTNSKQLQSMALEVKS
jgi:fibronectin type III domain protein